MFIPQVYDCVCPTTPDCCLGHTSLDRTESHTACDNASMRSVHGSRARVHGHPLHSSARSRNRVTSSSQTQRNVHTAGDYPAARRNRHLAGQGSAHLEHQRLSGEAEPLSITPRAHLLCASVTCRAKVCVCLCVYVCVCECVCVCVCVCVCALTHSSGLAFRQSPTRCGQLLDLVAWTR
jgi:hypothetical protein